MTRTSACRSGGAVTGRMTAVTTRTRSNATAESTTADSPGSSSATTPAVNETASTRLPSATA